MPGDGLSARGLAQAALRARAPGRAVHVLWCGARRPPFAAELARGGVGVSWLEQIDPPPAFGVPNVHGDCPSERSDTVRTALERLHERHPFDLIVFPALGGLGFRSIQARQAGLAFRGVTLAVYLDGSSARLREQQGRWPEGPDDLEVDYLERYSAEHADARVAPGEAMPDAPESPPRRPGEYAGGPPLVTVCVPHFNLGAYLPGALASLAAQTYPRLEVLVIDDGSTDPDSRAAFAAMRGRYPTFRFLTQPNAGIGATRNRGLREARGLYFLPFDADNVARPDLVERLVAGIHHRPELAALTCYFLAFEQDDPARRRYAYAYRPAGGPRLLASLRNVYGDATAIYRTEAFRAVGGYEPDRDTSFEDWEAFLKLTRAGYGVDVLPEHLFSYRHRPAGFSRVTGPYANHERVLRQFRAMAELPSEERAELWGALVGFHRRADRLAARQRCLRYRVADGVHAACRRVPLAARSVRWLRGLLAGRPKEVPEPSTEHPCSLEGSGGV